MSSHTYPYDFQMCNLHLQYKRRKSKCHKQCFQSQVFWFSGIFLNLYLMLDRIFKNSIVCLYFFAFCLKRSLITCRNCQPIHHSCYSDLWYGLDGLEFESRQRAFSFLRIFHIISGAHKVPS